MNATSRSIVLVLSVFVSWGLTAWLRLYAERWLLDVPNARSSHAKVTPRGAGVALVGTTLAAWAGLTWMGQSTMSWPVVLGGLAVAGIGFADDHRHVPPIVRLIVHGAAAVVAVASVSAGQSPADRVGGVSEVAAFGAGVLFVVWMINSTNFMDGIDGIAGVQTVTVCTGGAAIALAAGSSTWFESAVLAAAVVGFLRWNWPPARIFLGDVGSGYLGYMIAIYTIRAAADTPRLGVAWVVLSGVFLVDATVTLLVRAARGERVVEAHRSHAYQHLAARFQSHATVTILVGLVNIVWLLPCAWMIAAGEITPELGLVGACLPLAVAVVVIGAGRQGTVSHQRVGNPNSPN